MGLPRSQCKMHRNGNKPNGAFQWAPGQQGLVWAGQGGQFALTDFRNPWIWCSLRLDYSSSSCMRGGRRGQGLT